MEVLSDVNAKTTDFTNLIQEALDECAPFKRFKVKHDYKPGLTDAAKKFILERDQTRKKIKGASTPDKPSILSTNHSACQQVLSHYKSIPCLRENKQVIHSTKDTLFVVLKVLKLCC